MDFILRPSTIRRAVPKLVEDPMDLLIEDTLFGIEHGRLENGLCYYVGLYSNPKKQAALALAVKVGSVLEEDEERGVANIIGHLAYNGTSKYSNHDIMESIVQDIGSQGPVITTDVTAFEFLVPVDKPELLSRGISILAEFSSEVRISTNDLEKVQAIILEKYRGVRNAKGRMRDSHVKLLLEGSKVL